MKPIPIFLVTGFLGSGKTTLLWKWLHEAPVSGLRPAIVMNDFGAMSVDALILGRPDVSMETVEGGCMCCTDDTQLGNAVRRLARSGGRDLILVETSGLAEPDAVIDLLTDFDVASVAQLRGVLTVVSAAGFRALQDELAEWRLAERQLQFANIVFLSKCDLVSEAEIQFAKAKIAKVNPTARIVRLPFALPELPDLLKELAAATTVDPAGDRSEKHLHESYKSVTFPLPMPVPREKLETMLRGLDRKEVIRAKGFVRLAESPGEVHLFQQVFGWCSIDRFPVAPPLPPTTMVLIGPSVDVAKFGGQVREMMGLGSSIQIAAS